MRSFTCLKAEVREHLEIVSHRPALCGEVVAYHHAVSPGTEYQRCKLTEVLLSPAADDNIYLREHKPYERYYL